MKIVLTGGPSAGKTSLAQVLTRTYSDQIAIVPEAASILFSGGFPRGTQNEQIKCQQRAIFHVQKELETLGKLESQGRALICDRGSLDGLAYWPGTEIEFFTAIGSSMETELARYDWVIHLETAASENYKMQGVRIESSVAGMEVNARVKSAWRYHSKRIFIPNSSSFPTKIQLALKILKAILQNETYENVRKLATSNASIPTGQ